MVLGPFATQCSSAPLAPPFMAPPLELEAPPLASEAPPLAAPPLVLGAPPVSLGAPPDATPFASALQASTHKQNTGQSFSKYLTSPRPSCQITAHHCTLFGVVPAR